MRKIDFRAFLKVNKLMYKVLTLDIQEKKALIEHGDKRGYAKYPEECILMQYTGFKDSKGQEIYEGDIVSFDFEIDGSYFDTTVAQIVFGEKESCFMVKTKHPDNELLSEYLTGCSFCKIIGNIYESESLLDE